MMKMLLKGEVGGHALNSHGNYIVDHGKIMEFVFEFLREPCLSIITYVGIPPKDAIQCKYQNHIS